jgi:hypothetical protein
LFIIGCFHFGIEFGLVEITRPEHPAVRVGWATSRREAAWGITHT